jgi:hypothetical protein
MKVPFTVEQFMGVFQSYNQGIWPLQIVAYFLGIAAVVLALRRARYSDQVISGILALMWVWNGIVFHLIYSSAINPMARIFGPLFVLEGLLVFWFGAVRSQLSFRPAAGWRGGLGAVMILYAMIVYPIVGTLAGHIFPRAPIFGVAPCPTVIFTFGMFLWTTARFPKYLLVVPFLWSILATNVALPPFNVREDFGLLISGVVATALLAFRSERSEQSAQPAEEGPQLVTAPRAGGRA